MPKVKKNKRHLFDRRKNDTRKKTSKENIPPPPIPSNNPTTDLQQTNEGVLQRNHPNSMLSFLYDQLKEQNTDKWTTIVSESSLQLFTVLKEPKCQRRIQRTVKVCTCHVQTSHMHGMFMCVASY